MNEWCAMFVKFSSLKLKCFQMTHAPDWTYPIQNCAILSVSSFGSWCSKSGIYNLICCLQIVQRLKTSVHCIYCQLCLDLSNMAKEKKKNFLKRDSWRFPSSFYLFCVKPEPPLILTPAPHTQRPAPASHKDRLRLRNTGVAQQMLSIVAEGGDLLQYQEEIFQNYNLENFKFFWVL